MIVDCGLWIVDKVFGSWILDFGLKNPKYQNQILQSKIHDPKTLSTIHNPQSTIRLTLLPRFRRPEP
jgi:hypothetical protein